MNQKEIIINEYNTGNYQDKFTVFNQKYTEFQRDFATRALQKLTPGELLRTMCFQAENMDDMAHRLEYNDDFGNIKGNPRAMLEYLLSCDKNGQWRDRREDKNIPPRKAETIAEKIRDLLIFAISEIKKRPLRSVAEYEQLGADLGNKCNELKLPQDFYTHMWVRKYFHMICPDKMPSWYSRGMLNKVIEKLNLIKHKNLYANIGEIALFARDCNMPMIIFSDIVGVKMGLYNQENNTNVIKEGGNTTMTQAKKIPLNQILYGAPGTGKTYSTIIKAMEILDNDGGDYGFNISAERYQKLHTEFNELKKQGRIEFVTFHQSMAYEDFVEGIRPILDDSQTLGYRRVDGLFKKIADRANAEGAKQKYSNKEIPNTARIFKMSLGAGIENPVFEYCMEHNVIANNYGGTVDFSNAKKRQDIESLVTKNGLDKYAVTAMNFLRCEMKTGDIVMIANGKSEIAAIAEVNGNYQFNPDAEIEYKQFREVRWISKENLPVDAIIKNKKFSMQSIYELNRKDVNIERLNNLVTGNAPKDKKYVLVIDEINRGNISKIFGELITLVEESKRIGADEEMEVTLPYSQKPFGVPKNLYIIGTMNTADRSIAAIDIALRRRFKFTPVLPDARLIPETVENIKLREIFNRLNQKINALLDDGHLIGHSFWMKCKNLQDVKNSWFDEIMPLMNEYFYGDWEKLQYVLGADFVKSESVSDKDGQNLIGDDKSWHFVKYDDVSDADFVDFINKQA